MYPSKYGLSVVFFAKNSFTSVAVAKSFFKESNKLMVAAESDPLALASKLTKESVLDSSSLS